MTQRSFDLASLPEIKKVSFPVFSPKGTYKPYQADENLVPPFLPLGNDEHQVRINSSTHDNEGLIRKGTPESLNNTKRLREKIENALPDLTYYSLDEEPFASDLIVTYGVSSDAARDAVKELRSVDHKVSLLTINTILPVPGEVVQIINRYDHVTFVEENLSGLLKEIIFGQFPKPGISAVNKIGSMIGPSEIVAEVFRNHPL